ncbi:hypothetical protein Syun_011275 [Stephania yunnanensis]|uniref:Arf-GAP domain-containing protein n=1 Tax=Stephania yunnanensis TaxID=152371 RepID=A0AAP0JY91_9MAGN
MASRIKEDERNERIIRGLLKLPPNRKCINCNSLGPQYVCTNFWTFVCTTCSGIHREFTHRVKSVSMAKFTSQEVSALQGGGNERAREIYFKEWDPHRQTAPDSSNVDRLRDFIKHVYVDRRYTGDRVMDKPTRGTMGEKDDSFENRRVDSYHSGSRSPPYDDRNDRNSGDRSGLGGRNDDRNYRYNYDERRSPGYDQESRYGDNRRSPGRFEVVDDRYRNGRRSDESRSPNHEKDLDTTSPPMVRPVRDILGEDAPPLRISGPPKPNDGKVADGTAKTQLSLQRTASSSSLGSVDASSVELKRGNSGSLIDFNADTGPSATAAAPPAKPTTVSAVQSNAQPAASASGDSGNWASFDFAPQAQVQSQPQPPSSSNTLESLLFELSAPATAPVGLPSAVGGLTGAPVSTIPVAPVLGVAQPVTNNPALSINGGFSASPAGNVSFLSAGGGALAALPGGMVGIVPATGGNSSNGAIPGGQWPNAQINQPSLFAGADGQSIASQLSTPAAGIPNNQPWNSSIMQNVHGPLSTTSPHGQATSRPPQEPSGFALQPAPSEAKIPGRKELPADLFTATYSTIPMPVPRWHAGISPGMGYGMHYPAAVPMQIQPMQTFARPPKATNPFDLGGEPTIVHSQSFPSMASLQGALPNAAPSNLVHSSSFGGTPSSQWMPPQSSLYSSAIPPNVYGQQIPSNMQAFGHQGSVGSGVETNTFGGNQLPAASNSFSTVGGNPFG